MHPALDRFTACTADEDVCTDDYCDGAGTCTHPGIVLASACKFALLGAEKDGKDVEAKIGGKTVIDGSVCADRCRLGEESTTLLGADWVCTADRGALAKTAPRVCLDGGDLVTGGTCIAGIQGADALGTGARRLCENDDPCSLEHECGGTADACGDDPRLGDCVACQDSVEADATTVASLPPTDTIDRLSCADRLAPYCDGDKCTLTATTQLNVIEVDSLRLGEECVLELDGADIPNVVFILKVTRKFQTLAKAQIVLSGGALAENTLFAVTARKCDVGVNNVGVGTVFCSAAKARLKGNTTWTGAVIGGRSRVELGVDVDLTHQPFFGLAGPAPEIQDALR